MTALVPADEESPGAEECVGLSGSLSCIYNARIVENIQMVPTDEECIDYVSSWLGIRRDAAEALYRGTEEDITPQQAAMAVRNLLKVGDGQDVHSIIWGHL